STLLAGPGVADVVGVLGVVVLPGRARRLHRATAPAVTGVIGVPREPGVIGSGGRLRVAGFPRLLVVAAEPVIGVSPAGCADPGGARGQGPHPAVPTRLIGAGGSARALLAAGRAGGVPGFRRRLTAIAVLALAAVTGPAGVLGVGGAACLRVPGLRRPLTPVAGPGVVGVLGGATVLAVPLLAATSGLVGVLAGSAVLAAPDVLAVGGRVPAAPVLGRRTAGRAVAAPGALVPRVGQDRDRRVEPLLHVVRPRDHDPRPRGRHLRPHRLGHVGQRGSRRTGDGQDVGVR